MFHIVRALGVPWLATSFLMFWAGPGMAAENAPPSFWTPWNQVHAYAPDLTWDTGNLPKAARNALPKWMNEKDADGRSPSGPAAFASIDLDGDGKDELVVQSGEWFSGGPEFAILQRRGNRWKLIGEIQGGFTVSRRLKTGYVDIETWSRHPETYHLLWQFSEGRYRTVRTATGPWKDRGRDPPYVPGRKP